MEQYFHNAQRWQQHRADFENYKADFDTWQRSRSKIAPPPLPPDKPAVPKADIEQALAPVFIRRRRKDIRDLYGDTAVVSGQPVRFPEPSLQNVAYQLDRVYAKAGSLDEIEAMLSEHKGAGIGQPTTSSRRRGTNPNTVTCSGPRAASPC